MKYFQYRDDVFKEFEELIANFKRRAGVTPSSTMFDLFDRSAIELEKLLNKAKHDFDKQNKHLDDELLN